MSKRAIDEIDLTASDEEDQEIGGGGGANKKANHSDTQVQEVQEEDDGEELKGIEPQLKDLYQQLSTEDRALALAERRRLQEEEYATLRTIELIQQQDQEQLMGNEGAGAEFGESQEEEDASLALVMKLQQEEEQRQQQEQHQEQEHVKAEVFSAPISYQRTSTDNNPSSNPNPSKYQPFYLYRSNRLENVNPMVNERCLSLRDIFEEEENNPIEDVLICNYLVDIQCLLNELPR